MPNYFKIGQGSQWLRPASATCDFRVSHGTANSSRCTSPAALPWSCLCELRHETIESCIRYIFDDSGECRYV